MCDIGDKRKFLETLLNQRFNFLLVFFSLVVAGALKANNQVYFIIVLSVGAAICWLISLTVFRCQKKFDIIFDKLPLKHPAKLSDSKAKRIFGVRRIIGYILPALCSTLLTLASIFAKLGILMHG
jgi:putative Ca2+/H+ antiporter (TMEM165/GDT1 family)